MEHLEVWVPGRFSPKIYGIFTFFIMNRNVYQPGWLSLFFPASPDHFASRDAPIYIYIYNCLMEATVPDSMSKPLGPLVGVTCSCTELKCKSVSLGSGWLTWIHRTLKLSFIRNCFAILQSLILKWSKGQLRLN